MSEHAERCAVTVGDATGVEDCGRTLPCKEHEQCHCGRERWAHSEHAFNQPSNPHSECESTIAELRSILADSRASAQTAWDDNTRLRTEIRILSEKLEEK